MRLTSGLLAAQLGLLLANPVAAAQEDELVTAMPVATFQGKAVGETLEGGLIWRGGLVLDSDSDAFGGLSGLGFIDDQSRLVMVSDRGNFLHGQLIYDDAHRPFGLVGVAMTPLQNSRGAELPNDFSRDAEAMAIVHRGGRAAAVRVGFENLTRVADFDLVEGRPQGPARVVAIPDWLSDSRSNETLESLCIAPPASPVAGSTLLITEAIETDDGNRAGYMLGNRDRGAFALRPEAGVNPTDCAFLPNGDLLVLERGVQLFAFVVKLRRIPAAEVRPRAVLTGQVLIEARGSDIDNMEAMAVHQGPGGETRITLVADNNFNDWERTLLLEFGVPN